MADDDLDIGNDQDNAVLLRTEMAMSEFLLRYWLHATVAAVVVVFGIAAYGQWSSMYVESQRQTTAAIADVEADLPAAPNPNMSSLMWLAQQKAMAQAVDVAAVTSAADKLVDVAQGADGTSAVEAWLKAAELYRIADNAERRRFALDHAAELADGVLRYAAVAALANLDLEQDKADEAIARFKALQSEAPFLARQAMLDLASTYEALGRGDEAVATYDSYLAKFPDAPDADDVRGRRDKAAAATGSAG
ncbi:MAG: tetratricopeptide repeat protein [Alphaproteobacteria bacterium]|nr:tetratricopeptide repeat protein [Alphaproteobacteria bacterium]